MRTEEGGRKKVIQAAMEKSVPIAKKAKNSRGYLREEKNEYGILVSEKKKSSLAGKKEGIRKAKKVCGGPGWQFKERAVWEEVGEPPPEEKEEGRRIRLRYSAPREKG